MERGGGGVGDVGGDGKGGGRRSTGKGKGRGKEAVSTILPYLQYRAIGAGDCGSRFPDWWGWWLLRHVQLPFFAHLPEQLDACKAQLVPPGKGGVGGWMTD